MPLIIENDAAADRLRDLTSLALETGTYEGLIRKLNYLATYGEKGDGEHRVWLMSYDGGDPRKGHSIGLKWEWRPVRSVKWNATLHGGLVYHERAEAGREWSTHT